MIAAVVERAGDQLGAFLPRIVGALLLLVVGLLLAIVLGRLTRRGLVRAGLDRFADRTGTNELLSQAGLGSSLAALVGTAVRITIVVVVCFGAMTLLGLEFLSDSLNEAILYIPRLLAALALVLIGVVLGGVPARVGRAHVRAARLPGRDRAGDPGAGDRPVRALRGGPGRRRRRPADGDRDRGARARSRSRWRWPSGSGRARSRGR